MNGNIDFQNVCSESVVDAVQLLTHAGLAVTLLVYSSGTQYRTIHIRSSERTLVWSERGQIERPLPQNIQDILLPHEKNPWSIHIVLEGKSAA